MTEYRVKITQRLTSEICECLAFVNTVSPQAADQLSKEISEAIRSLQFFPNRYPEISDLEILGVKMRKMPIHDGRYLVLYKVLKDEVIVCDLVDVRKDIKFAQSL